jgi:oligoribonuclease NrnB/cAMP/cGMP phosphodiesterase (DHH superfamily)
MEQSKIYDLYDYVIYHKNCFDGFAGFFLLTLTNRIHKNAIIYPDVPSNNNTPPNINNKNIIIIDVAYKKSVIQNILNKVKKMTFIDHHISIREDILSMNITQPHELVYDEHKSGASLVWQYFNVNKKEPLFIRYIEDNDIGAWKLKYTIPFINALQVNYKTTPNEYNLNKWKNLFSKKEVRKLIKIGKIYDEYKEYLLEQNIKKYSLESFPGYKLYDMFPNFFNKPGQYKVALYNGSGCPSSSHLSIKFLENVDCDFIIFWVLNMDRKEYILQFRSNIVDVAKIAKLFGGGGHTLASACSIPIDKINIIDLFMPDSLPRHQ